MTPVYKKLIKTVKLFRWVLLLSCMSGPLIAANLSSADPELELAEQPEWWVLYSLQQEQRAKETLTLPAERTSVPLRELNNNKALRIDGLSNQLNLGFGSRSDQLVESATLYLDFAYSPTLAGDVSQLRVHLNNEYIGAIQLRAERANQKHQYEFQLPAEYFGRYNELQFELLAEAIGFSCAVVSPSAWLELSNSSRLVMNKRQLVRASDLSWFPEPFIDMRDFNNVHLHYLLPEQIEPEFVQAAGILNSYFGMKGAWRGITTERSVYKNEPDGMDNETFTPGLPEQHAIVLMTNEQRPWQFYDLAPVTKTTVRMVTNPENRIYKLLLIHAPDTASLTQAVQALASEQMILSGPVATVNALDITPRPVYSAPRWISTRKKVEFGELVEFNTSLQREGYSGGPIGLNLILPPDLFISRRDGVPIDLKFRYSPPIQTDESRMKVYVNNEFIQGYTLNETGMGGNNERIRIPVFGHNPFATAALQIPAFKLGAVNSLEFDFTFSAMTEECRVRPIGNTVGAIDSASTIDLRGYEHYTEMPNLHLFAKSGYPFSRYDDLSNTLLVTDNIITDNEFKTAMNTLALMGSATGYHGSLLRVTTVAELEPKAKEDILIVGGTALQQWFERFGRKAFDRQLNAHGLAGERKLFFTESEAVSISGPTAAIISFQSPLSSDATVVALTANQDAFLLQINELLRSSERTTSMAGFMSLLTPGNERHFGNHHNYYVGELSWLKRMHYHIARYPAVAALVTLFALITLVLVIYWFFSSLASRRKKVN